MHPGPGAACILNFDSLNSHFCDMLNVDVVHPGPGLNFKTCWLLLLTSQSSLV